MPTWQCELRSANSKRREILPLWRVPLPSLFLEITQLYSFYRVFSIHCFISASIFADIVMNKFFKSEDTLVTGVFWYDIMCLVSEYLKKRDPALCHLMQEKQVKVNLCFNGIDRCSRRMFFFVIKLRISLASSLISPIETVCLDFIPSLQLYVPVMHGYAHVSGCATEFGARQNKWAAMTVSEICEEIWSWLGKYRNPVYYMTYQRLVVSNSTKFIMHIARRPFFQHSLSHSLSFLLVC